MSKPRHVLVVGCGFPQLGLIRAAKRLGVRVTGADLNPRAIGVQELDAFVCASTGDEQAIADAFKHSGASGIATSGSELALTTTAAVAQKLGLPFYADTATVHRCQAKDAMRAGYLAAGLKVPGFAHCTRLEQARRFAQEQGYPVIVKPSHGWGQRGVSRVESDQELPQAFARACELSHGERGAVLEGCITGHEVSVNGWVEDGELQVYCVTDRVVFEGKSPLGVMQSEISPSTLPAGQVQLAVETARRGARALGLMRGPCYSQVAVRPDGAMLFETAARLGGGFDADVTRMASGVDLYARLLGVALGDRDLERAGQVTRNRPAMVRFLAPRPGKLRELSGLEQARAVSGVHDVAVYPREGDLVPALSDAAKRVGHILVEADTREQLLARAQQAEQCIRMVVEDAE